MIISNYYIIKSEKELNDLTKRLRVDCPSKPTEYPVAIKLDMDNHGDYYEFTSLSEIKELYDKILQAKDEITFDERKSKAVEIPVEFTDGNAVLCLSKGCAFKKECANHTTAGDFRSEDGFSPELFWLDDKKEKVGCFTMIRPLDIEFKHHGYFPERCEELMRGFTNVMEKLNENRQENQNS